MKNPKVAVVILNWNGKDFLAKFLPDVIKHSQEDAEVIVADNASSDGSVDYLKKDFPQIKIIQNEVNGGYAKGYNDALAQIEADYYVLLNSDIEVTPQWIKPIIRLMEEDNKVVACQPKLLSYFAREEFEYAGASGGVIDKYGYPFCRGRLFQTLEKDEGQYNSVMEVFWATGACLFMRAKVFHELGGLDERFFAHMEEIDFCWRAKNAGYKIMVCPESKVYHVGGGTLPKHSWTKTYLNMRNNNIMMFKNLPANRLFPVFASRLILDGVAAIKFLFDGGIMDFWAVIKAHWKFFLLLPQLIKGRKSAHLQFTSNVYQKNIVFEYFIRKIKKFSDLDIDKFS